ncbi:hypothetical protein [Oceanobacillus kimchii]|nr:hypothetical protein [Oceanobacillus kimchii]
MPVSKKEHEKLKEQVDGLEKAFFQLTEVVKDLKEKEKGPTYFS